MGHTCSGELSIRRTSLDPPDGIDLCTDGTGELDPQVSGGGFDREWLVDPERTGGRWCCGMCDVVDVIGRGLHSQGCIEDTDTVDIVAPDPFGWPMMLFGADTLTEPSTVVTAPRCRELSPAERSNGPLLLHKLAGARHRIPSRRLASVSVNLMTNGD